MRNWKVSLTPKYTLPTSPGRNARGPALPVAPSTLQQRCPLVRPLLQRSRATAEFLDSPFILTTAFSFLGCRGAPGRWRGVVRPHVTFQSSSPTHDHCPSETLPSLPVLWLPWPLPSGHSPFHLTHSALLYLLTSLLSDFPTGMSTSWVQEQGLFFVGVSILSTNCILSTKNNAWTIVGSQ